MLWLLLTVCICLYQSRLCAAAVPAVRLPLSHAEKLLLAEGSKLP
jgi:hypothetical protein